MSLIYRSSPTKWSKPGGSGGGSGSVTGGRRPVGSGSWTLVGPEPKKGNPDWPCPSKGLFCVYVHEDKEEQLFTVRRVPDPATLPRTSRKSVCFPRCPSGVCLDCKNLDTSQGRHGVCETRRLSLAPVASPCVFPVAPVAFV